MKKLTRQEIFNKVWKHAIVEKNPKSLDEWLDCKYRGPDNKKCFLGVCIPDNLYQQRFEGYAADTIFNVIGNKLFDKRSVGVHFLHAIQSIHDKSETHHWEELLREFATANKLVVPD